LLQQHALAVAASQQAAAQGQAVPQLSPQQVSAQQAALQQQKSMVLDLSAGRQAAAAAVAMAVAAAAAASVGVPSSTSAQTTTLPEVAATSEPLAAGEIEAEHERETSVCREELNK
jgi:hypothetical protein